ncbi:MAG: ATP-binding protein, partial [Alphaproteobacteria bacterium]
ENAIKYAVTPLEEGADINVTARLTGMEPERRLIITVTDTGPGLTDGVTRPTYSTGVGLANIRDRLAQAYGTDQRFEVQTDRAEGFGVVIDIPFHTAKQRKDNA